MAGRGVQEAPMEWDFEFLPEHGVLTVRTHGDLGYDAMVEFITACADAMQRCGCDRILVDHRDAVLQLSPTRLYRLPAVEVAHGIDRRRRVAVVISPATTRAEDVRIYADVMRANGPPHCVVDDPGAALDWLLERKANGA
jgi:hypothetical protein